ncbi:MAG: transcription antitermination factor NusB [Magnetococcales bacterium]|nr:transcription antitermination factor NusB [Magnetococcales bacterium]NGZ26664.1 transcription antitermination factor NusB [Magnetococcales bacterium]
MTQGTAGESNPTSRPRRGGRHLARELALQALYQSDITGDGISDAVIQLVEDPVTEERTDLAYFRHLAAEVWKRKAELDHWIGQVTENWSLDRVSVIELNILRLGIYELLWQRDVPERVIINEAIELAKRFGGENSHRFVNGIMDQVAMRVRPEERESMR